MNQALPPFAPTPLDPPEVHTPPLPGPRASADEVMSAYVGLLAGWFEIGRLAAGRKLNRAGVHTHLLNDG